MNWHSKNAIQIIKELNSSNEGLSQEEAKSRLDKFGPNKLPEAKSKNLILVFLEQFKSPLIYVLIVADVIVFYLKEFTDGLIILFILLFNATLGTIQEGRAQNTLKALSKLTKTRAEVIRGGRTLDISDEELVKGDIIILQEGQKVPADVRLLETQNLKIDEASLTGESEPVRKNAETIEKENPSLADKKNMAFKGTAVAVGTGRAIVVATGINTEIGGISINIAQINTEIPLTKNLRQLARVVVGVVLILIAVIFGLGFLNGRDLAEMFTASVAISVAAVPEGLPLILTVTLAAGVWRMAKHKVLVKKLQAVEALGQAKTIAVDKTGTITRNELVIQKVIAGGKEFDIQGIGYKPAPLIKNPDKELKLAAKISALCSNANISFSEEENQFRLIGDPTEGAMTAFASKLGIKKSDYKLIKDWPFDYQKKFHLSLCEEKGKKFLAITGAPEAIINLSKLTEAEKEIFENKFLKLSEEGLRVIAFAHSNDVLNTDPDNLPRFNFGGFLAMRDALRAGIYESIMQAKNAGIRTVMITGDHALTAKTIAKRAGIYNDGEVIITGEEIDSLSEQELSEKLKHASVFARVTPEHKLKIIERFRANGEIVAMTGDGVNDAPSLVAADLGIAMGKIGTEVAKEASDLVLMEDNFKDILTAVNEGRNLREGMRRAITYLFSSNLGEIFMIIITLIAGLPLPLLAAQIIWMNVVTDTFFDISLALEPQSKSQKQDKIHKKLFDKLITARLLIIAPIIAVGGFFLFLSEINDPVRARTFALTSLVVFQWFNALNCRSEEKSIFQMNFFSNKFLLATLFGVVILHNFAIYTPFMNKILSISPLGFIDWIKIVLVGLVILAAEETRKIFYRRKLFPKPAIQK